MMNPLPVKAARSRQFLRIAALSAIGIVALAVLLCVAYRPATLMPHALRRVGKLLGKDLPDCDLNPGLVCAGSSGDMDEKWKDNLWNTPPRNHSRWLPGFQDMNVLQGYPRLEYSADRKSCNVTIFTKTKSPLALTYFFQGVAQTSPSKTFNTTWSSCIC
jgi:hypothetical protein